MYMQNDTGQAIASAIGNIEVDTSALMKDTTGQAIVTAINNISGAISPSADNVTYDNTASGLSASNVQAAVDELESEKLTKIDSIESITAPIVLSSGSHATVTSLTLDPGLYLINAGVSFENNATGIRRMFISRAGTSTNTPAVTDTDISLIEKTVNAAYFSSTNIYTQSVNISTIGRITSTYPTLYLRAYQNSGGDMNVTGTIQAIKIS